MSYALHLTPYILCLTSYVLCLMSYVLCLMSYVLCLTLKLSDRFLQYKQPLLSQTYSDSRFPFLTDKAN